MGRLDQPGVPVDVEVLLVGVRAGALTYRGIGRPLASDQHPDACAGRLAADALSAVVEAGHGGARSDGPQPGWAPPPLSILHSTSWRFTGGRVVLTYVAVADGLADAIATVLGEHGIAYSGDPTAPSPPHVCPAAVATHAARHLAWLREHDEVIATALAGLPSLWHALDDYAPVPAGQAFPVVLEGSPLS